MKKAFFIAAVFLGFWESSCVQPPEQQESEAAIRDSTLRQDAAERTQQKLGTKKALQDSLKQATVQLVFYQESLEEKKANLQMAKDELKRIQGPVTGKSNSDDSDQIKYLTLRISTLEADIESNTDKIIAAQDAINKMKADLQKFN